MNTLTLNKVLLNARPLNMRRRVVKDKDFIYKVLDREFTFSKTASGKSIKSSNARIEAIKGNSVVWNQLIERLNNNANTGSAFIGLTYAYDESSSILTINGTATGTWQGSILFAKTIIGNIYYISAQKVGGSYTKAGSEEVRIFNGYYPSAHPESSPEAISSLSKNNREYLGIGCNVGDVFDNYQVRVQYVNLTQMFGAGNEPTTIEEYNARKPIVEDEYAYNEGEVIHMDVQSIESVGVNQWDEEWEEGSIDANTGLNVQSSDYIRSKAYIPIIPNTRYYITLLEGGYKLLRARFYDKGKNIIGYLDKNGAEIHTNTEWITPNNAYYMKIAPLKSMVSEDVKLCINLSDASINGKYFPYVKRMQSLDIIRKYFPQGMKSAGSAHDEIRYNKASGKWEAVQRIGIFDKWEGRTISNVDNPNLYSFPTGMLSDVATPKANEVICIHEKYEGKSQDTLNATESNGIAVYKSMRLWIKDMDVTSDPEALITKLIGTKLYYKLAEPIVTELDAEDQLRNFDYQVWNCGTEQAIAEGQTSPIKADIGYHILKNNLELTLNS